MRPEALHISTDGVGMQANIDTVEELGSDSFLYCTPHGHEGIIGGVTGRGPEQCPAGRHASTLKPDAGSLHLFDAATGARLPD